MNSTRLASASAYLAWKSSDATHQDWRFFPSIDIRRDSIPAPIEQQLSDLHIGDTATAIMPSGELFPPRTAESLKQLRLGQVANIFTRRRLPGPYIGRHYPKGLLVECEDAGAIQAEDMTPVRITGMDDKQIEFDFNHPLAEYELKIGLRLSELLPNSDKRGGQRKDITTDIAMHGSGLQSCPSSLRPVFFTDNCFRRIHEQRDSGFYGLPRFVQHIDSQARSIINQYYRRHIKPGMQVLDLMSSWESHLQGIDDSVQVSGLGMNNQELLANPALHAHHIHDLNMQLKLPYQDRSFDIVVCTVSVEYLTDPVSVLRELARVLRPAGKVLITFSDRWFPEKVIKVWTELHPYERMNLVLEYFRSSGQFDKLATESWQGWLRPEDDMYYAEKRFSDPVFAVQATRK